MAQVWREFREWREDEATRVEARVREFEKVCVGLRVGVEEQIEINRARGVEGVASATQAVFDAKQTREKLFGRGRVRVERQLGDHIQIVRLYVRDFNRLGLVNGGEARDD